MKTLTILLLTALIVPVGAFAAKKDKTFCYYDDQICFCTIGEHYCTYGYKKGKKSK